MNKSLIIGCEVRGIDAHSVAINAEVSAGMPAFDFIGLGEACAREVRVRVRSAIRAAGLPFPRERTIVRLEQDDVARKGTHYDLGIAIAVLTAAGTIPAAAVEAMVPLAELSLGGDLRPVTGVVAVAERLATMGEIRKKPCTLIVHPDNAAEALAVGGVNVRIERRLADVVACLRGQQPWPELSTPAQLEPSAWPLCWSDVRGHAQAKRALEVAAAGGHNVALIGAPGCGKTMLARRLPTILPPLTRYEAVETSKVHSVAGLLPARAGLMTERPFRAPHHTAATSALVGGGNPPRPGEASLAHNGVLFLDELPEFPRTVLENLVPVAQDGVVEVRGVRMPTKTMLVAALNPCPCGNKGVKKCTCTVSQVDRYYERLPIALMKYFDICVSIPMWHPSELRTAAPGETSATVRERVARVRALGRVHNRSETTAVERVARTIADLAGSEAVLPEHEAEARALTGGFNHV